MVAQALLEQLAAMVPEPPARPASRQRAQAFDLDQWLIDHSDRLHVVATGPWNAGQKWVLSPCPWDASHLNQSAFIVRFPTGAIVAGCHHNSCAGKGWRELRASIESCDVTMSPQRAEPEDEEEPLPEILITKRRLRRITAD